MCCLSRLSGAIRTSLLPPLQLWLCAWHQAQEREDPHLISPSTGRHYGGGNQPSLRSLPAAAAGRWIAQGDPGQRATRRAPPALAPPSLTLCHPAPSSRERLIATPHRVVSAAVLALCHCCFSTGPKLNRKTRFSSQLPANTITSLDM